MYKKPYYSWTQMHVNTSVQGETIETKIERVVNNKEPIKDGAPLIYTERKEGVKRSTNIKTDRWEVAVEAMDKVSKSFKAKREERINPEAEKKMNSEAENTQGTAA